MAERDRGKFQLQIARQAVVERDCYDTRGGARWHSDYNHRQPQRALGKQTPAEYAAKCEVSAARRVMQRMETVEKTRKTTSIIISETA